MNPLHRVWLKTRRTAAAKPAQIAKTARLSCIPADGVCGWGIIRGEESLRFSHMVSCRQPTGGNYLVIFHRLHRFASLFVAISIFRFSHYLLNNFQPMSNLHTCPDGAQFSYGYATYSKRLLVTESTIEVRLGQIQAISVLILSD